MLNNLSSAGNTHCIIVQEEDMVKGVNRNIIEINDTGSIYFERAVLYLRPDAAGITPELARIAADRYLDGIGVDCRRRSIALRRGKMIITLLLALTVLAIAAVLLTSTI